MQEWVFTFGTGHYPYGNCYTKIKAADFNAAREEMHRISGKIWGFQYDSEEEAGVKAWGLKYVTPEEIERTPPRLARSSAVETARFVTVNAWPDLDT